MLDVFYNEKGLHKKWAEMRLANLPQNRQSHPEAGLDILRAR